MRSLAPPVRAQIDGDWIKFDRAEYGVAPGQAAVCYDGSRLLGGGWIAETAAAEYESGRRGAEGVPEHDRYPELSVKSDDSMVSRSVWPSGSRWMRISVPGKRR